MDSSKEPLLVIVTGYSGAGKSIAINALEDLSFYCIDNLPLELLDSTINFFLTNPNGISRFALGLDMRTSEFAKKFAALKAGIREKIKTDVVFLTCSDDVLSRRFSTTRRKHPFVAEVGDVTAAIRREADSLNAVESEADVCMDTSTWSPHFLARTIEKRYAGSEIGRNLYVSIVSFGFKYGSLQPVDSVFDVRFLKNPYFEPQLSAMTGFDKEIQDYVLEDEKTQEFLKKLCDLHNFLLPHYYEEGKHYFRIGIGCTGGRHRSVAIAECLARLIADLTPSHISLSVSHRDVHAQLQNDSL